MKTIRALLKTEPHEASESDVMKIQSGFGHRVATKILKQVCWDETDVCFTLYEVAREMCDGNLAHAIEQTEGALELMRQQQKGE